MIPKAREMKALLPLVKAGNQEACRKWVRGALYNYALKQGFKKAEAYCIATDPALDLVRFDVREV